MSGAAWTKRHVIEAHAVMYELAAQAAREERRDRLDWLLCSSRTSELAFRLDLGFAGYTPDEVNGIIRRIREAVS